MHLQPLERAIILLCRRIGARGVIALITATSITLSVVMTLVLVVPQFSLDYSTDLILAVSVAIAVAVPLVIAPITSGLFISLLVRLDNAYVTLLKLSTTDSLTGATNRRGFFADVTARVESLDRNDSIFVGMVDLNSFKNLNDSFGHQFGDEALCAVVSRLRLVLGEDVVGRLGGDEFAFLITGSHSKTRQVIQEVYAQCRSFTLEYQGESEYKEQAECKGEPILVSSSIGIVPWDRQASLDQALALADKDLYAEKYLTKDSGGRNPRKPQNHYHNDICNSNPEIQQLNGITNAKYVNEYVSEIEDLYNNAPCGYHSLNSEGKIVNINNTELQWLGYSREEILGKSFTQIVTAESIQSFRSTFEEFKRKGWIRDKEYDLICKDGRIFPVFLSATAVKDDQGNYLYSRSTLFDARDRKQFEQEILAKQHFIQKIIESSPNILYLYDLEENRNLYCNREISNTLGYSAAEVQAMGASFFVSLMHPDDLAKLPDYYGQFDSAQDGDIFEIEYRMRHANGEWRWLLSRDSAFKRDERGRVKQTIGTAQDISDRKQAEILIQQTTAQLEASNRELEAFAYSVSHDLRSPLRAIDGFSTALLEDYGDKLDDDAQDYLDRIRRNIQRMGMLIDDLLRLSRVSRSEMQYQSVNLSELVRQQLQDLQAIDSDRTVECMIRDGAIVQADPALMAVVINNLCQNAWKFTSHHPTAKIEFGMILQDENNGQNQDPIYFLRDDGAGFDMRYTNKLFGVFQRLHNTNEFIGTGIGLASVQRAILRHGGKVWAEAAVEQGATFYFTVPTTMV